MVVPIAIANQGLMVLFVPGFSVFLEWMTPKWIWEGSDTGAASEFFIHERSSFRSFYFELGGSKVHGASEPPMNDHDSCFRPRSPFFLMVFQNIDQGEVSQLIGCRPLHMWALLQTPFHCVGVPPR